MLDQPSMSIQARIQPSCWHSSSSNSRQQQQQQQCMSRPVPVGAGLLPFPATWRPPKQQHAPLSQADCVTPGIDPADIQISKRQKPMAIAQQLQHQMRSPVSGAGPGAAATATQALVPQAGAASAAGSGMGPAVGGSAGPKPAAAAAAAAAPVARQKRISAHLQDSQYLLELEAVVPDVSVLCPGRPQPFAGLCGRRICFLDRREVDKSVLPDPATGWSLGVGADGAVLVGQVLQPPSAAAAASSAPASSVGSSGGGIGSSSSSSSSCGPAHPSQSVMGQPLQQQGMGQVPQYVAVKVFLIGDGDGQYSAFDVQRFRNERTVMAILAQHCVPHVVQLLCDAQVTRRDGKVLYCLVMELKQRNLHRALRSGMGLSTKPNSSPLWRLDMASIKRVVRQLLQFLSGMANAEALKHIVVHRDLKAGNIMLDNAGKIFVADFGHSSCKSLQDAPADGMMHSNVGTVTHASPEIFTDSHTSAVDVWSLGVCVVELLAVSPSIPGVHFLLPPGTWSTAAESSGRQQWVEWLQRFGQGGLLSDIPGRFDCWDAGPASVRSFVAACCAKSTAPLQQRLAELTAHKWLQEG